jgi:hypothetical protein
MMTVYFHLHSELDVVMDTLQLFKEAHHFFRTMGPGYKSIIHVQQLAEGLRDCPVKCHLLK